MESAVQRNGDGSPASWLPAPAMARLKGLVEKRKVAGFVAGVVRRDETAVFGHGTSAADGVSLDAYAVFEIGSITKTFTGTLLADMVLRGEVSLDHPAQKYLEAKVPRRTRDITLLDLATHTSGLPRMPPGTRKRLKADKNNPFADYARAQLCDTLQTCEPKHDPGAKFAYSNFGFAVLGAALGQAAGKTYQELVEERIFDPLGMKDSAFDLTPELRARRTQGHSYRLKHVTDWDLASFAPAGAIQSTVADMLLYLRANMRPQETPMAGAIELAQRCHHVVKEGKRAIGLGWVHKADMLWHNGGTRGFGSYLAFERDTGVGIVVLSNSRPSLTFRLDRASRALLKELAG